MVKVSTMPIGRTLLLVTFALLVGCASHLPDAIRKAPPDDIQPNTVRHAPDSLRGKPVRWGGHILSLRNLKEETQIEIVTRGLDSDGRPLEDDRSQGRFLAKVNGFVDPTVYEKGREITVSGQVEGVSKQTIGDFQYDYPVVRAEQVHLWEKRASPHPDYYYDPFYSPFWSPWNNPYYPYPGYRPYYRPR